MAEKTRSGTTTQEKVNVYETTSPLLKAMYREIQELSKKKPDATLSKRKVATVNNLLSDIKDMLADEPESKYLELLDDDELLQYSDVVLMLSQYSAAMGEFYSRYYRRAIELPDPMDGQWHT